ncbi:hypothetical protein SDC9_110993 [bioreactor metagenome]|uniref:Uncharacterized protein n=1 Tax=bioreactor metagenome TaxID=1076179 RepID=A0A645BFJ6_9ZZZZ
MEFRHNFIGLLAGFLEEGIILIKLFDFPFTICEGFGDSDSGDTVFQIGIDFPDGNTIFRKGLFHACS